MCSYLFVVLVAVAEAMRIVAVVWAFVSIVIAIVAIVYMRAHRFFYSVPLRYDYEQYFEMCLIAIARRHCIHVLLNDTSSFSASRPTIQTPTDCELHQVHVWTTWSHSHLR